jgi:hypothetical protein
MEERAWPSTTSQWAGWFAARQLLGRSSDEIRDDCIDDDATATDQEPGLAGGAEI